MSDSFIPKISSHTTGDFYRSPVSPTVGLLIRLAGVISRSGQIIRKVGILLLALQVSPITFAADDRIIDFDIPEQEADKALTEFARQARTAVFFPAEKLGETTSSLLRGKYTIEQGLGILLQGTGFSASYTKTGILTVKSMIGLGEEKVNNNISRKRSGLFASIAALMAAGGTGAPTVVAQEAGPRSLEEVVVTAQKISQNLQEVPIAVSSFSAESLDKLGISNVSQIADFAPNVTLDFTAPISGSSSALVSFVRGIGQSDFAMNFEPGVGLYVDGVYMARNMGGVIDLLDLERIEILKGPQGTLFGRNTPGGAINVVTKKPDQELGGNIELTLGEDNRQDIRGVVNIPLSDTLFSSIAVSSKNRDGYVKRIPYPNTLPADQTDFRSIDQGVLNDLPNGNDLGNENNDTVRAKLLWQFAEDQELLLSYDYTRVRENSAPTVLETAELWQATGGIAGLYNACVSGMGPPVCGSIIDGRTGNVIDPMFTERTPYDNRFLTGNDHTTYGNSISGTALDAWGISATYEWDISDTLSFKSITAYRDLESIFGEDADMSPLIIDHHGFELNQEQISQEFQLIGTGEKLKWVAGLYYFNEEGENNDYVPLAGGLFQVDGPNDIENTSYAAFGQLTYNVTEDWSVTLGARVTREEKEFTGGQTDRNDLSAKFGVPLAAFPDPTDTTRLFPLGEQEQDFDDTSIRLGTEYRFSDSLFAYVSFSQGFKAGGWDTRLTGPELVAPDFEEENVESYEIGLKSDWFDNTLRINLAAFHTDYENLQLVIQRGISPLTANAGESEIDGFEVDFQWLATDNLQVTGSLGWIDAEYTKLDARANAVGIFLDNEFNNTPEKVASIAFDYNQPLASGASLAIHLDYAWKDDHFNDAVNTPELAEDAFGLTNLSIRYNSPDERWHATLGVQNLTDEDYVMSGFNQPGVGYIIKTIGRPREWWLTLGMDF